MNMRMPSFEKPSTGLIAAAAVGAVILGIGFTFARGMLRKDVGDDSQYRPEHAWG